MGSEHIWRNPKHSLFHRIAVSDDAPLENRRRTWNRRQGCRQSTTGAGLRYRQRLVPLLEQGDHHRRQAVRIDAVSVIARATTQLSLQRHQQLSGGIGTGRTGREPQFHIAEGGIRSHRWVGRLQ